jgi:hypothetical protein
MGARLSGGAFFLSGTSPLATLPGSLLRLIVEPTQSNVTLQRSGWGQGGVLPLSAVPEPSKYTPNFCLSSKKENAKSEATA